MSLGSQIRRGHNIYVSLIKKPNAHALKISTILNFFEMFCGTCTIEIPLGEEKFIHFNKFGANLFNFFTVSGLAKVVAVPKWLKGLLPRNP